MLSFSIGDTICIISFIPGMIGLLLILVGLILLLVRAVRKKNKRGAKTQKESRKMYCDRHNFCSASFYRDNLR